MGTSVGNGANRSSKTVAKRNNSKMAILKSLTGFVVFAADGSIDVDATCDKIKSGIVVELEHNAVMDSKIESALDNVFTRLNVDVYPTPEVVSMASAILVGNEITKMAEVSEQVRDYLSRSSRFVGVRGRKGGLRKVK